MTLRPLDQHPADRAGSRNAALLVSARPAAAFVLLALLVAGEVGPVLRFDAWVSAAAHAAALAHPLWRTVMAGVTTTGSMTVLGPLTAVGCAILLVRGRWRQAVFVVAAMAAVVCLRLIPLAIIARPRPADQLAPASNYSFPSGHSTASAAAALILVLVCWPLLRSRWSRIVLPVAAGLWALAVGVSRVALVVHWPSDVVGAWLFVLTVVPLVGLLLRALFGGGAPPSGGDQPA